MKKKRFVCLALTFLSALTPQLSTCFAQGSLTPPGAPAPTMKTLAQIEPRTPISSAPFTITSPGSYYLTTNLTVSGGDAITIATDGVMLDLNGFRITSTATVVTGTGIAINAGMRDLAIRNGFVQGGVTNNGSGLFSGSGFENGILGNPYNTRVSGVSVSGCLYEGIYLYGGNGTVVESCTARTVGDTGIQASIVTASEATDCGAYAIYGLAVSDCQGQANGSGTGLYGFRTAQNCYGSSSGSGTGLFSNQAQNCQGNSSSGIGLSATQAQNCQGQSVSGTGLSATTAQNCLGASTSGTGLNGTFVSNCRGFSASAIGLSGKTAHNSEGWSNGNTGMTVDVASGCWAHGAGAVYGLSAKIATSCYAEGGQGLYAERSAQNCTGLASGSGSGYGIFTSQAENCQGNHTGIGTGLSAVTAQNCRGNAINGTALTATTAQNCYGVTTGSGTGLSANLAIGCYGQSTANGTGLNAYIANSCQGVSLSGTPLSFSFKYNMP